jgi:hypothetical protein
MSPQRFAVTAALCGTLVLVGWVAIGLAGLGPHGIKNGGAAIEVDASLATAMAENSVSVADIGSVRAALAEPREMLSTATPPVQTASPSTRNTEQKGGEATSSPIEVPAAPSVRLASLFTSDAAKEYPKPVARSVEILNECLVAEICIDEYLWSLYERTPKFDTNKVTQRVKATVKKKGKTRIVTKTITKYVLGDFTWKDPIAAQRAGMSLKDYVIGGMDRSFKLKLYRALRAMDDAGLMPGITSAFRDDYRQAITVGRKAASDSSYHGGSRRGGYGHGLAADLVSVKGETRVQRHASNKELWNWIDANERELGIGRPYRERDPPHVGPIDGKEYIAKRGWANVQRAGL